MNKNHLILGGLTVILLLVLIFVPEYKKPGESVTLLDYDLKEILNIKYQGEMQYDADKKVNVHYTISPQVYEPSQLGFLYRYRIIRIAPEEKIRPGDLAIKQFNGGTILKGIINDVRQLAFQYKIEGKPTPQQLKQYGLDKCNKTLQVMTREKTHKYCIGKGNFGNARRYIQDTADKQIYLVHNYIISRFEKNVYSYQDQRLNMFKRDLVDEAVLKVHERHRRRYKNLFEQRQGVLVINSTKKRHEKTDKEYRTWFVDGFDKIDSPALERLVEVLHDVRIVAFSVGKPEKITDADMVVTFYQKDENNKREALGSAQLWVGNYSKRWLTGRAVTALNRGDSFAYSEQNAGIYQAVQRKSIEDQLARVDIEIKKHLLQLEREKEIQAKKTMPTPQKP